MLGQNNSITGGGTGKEGTWAEVAESRRTWEAEKRGLHMSNSCERPSEAQVRLCSMIQSENTSQAKLVRLIARRGGEGASKR